MKKSIITEETKKEYIEIYKETYSVSEILRRCGTNIGRNKIVEILKTAKVYEGLNGENYLRKKVENYEKIMMQKYGVINWGQTSDGGYKTQNKIPYKKISYLTKEYKDYRNNVEKLTRFTIKKHFKELPKYCFYTEILFADEEGPANPNDPRKRSIDHRIPILHCYLNGVEPEIASSLDNVIFVLKYVNTVKGQTLEESFAPLVEKIKKVFINEGYKSKQINRKVSTV